MYIDIKCTEVANGLV